MDARELRIGNIVQWVTDDNATVAVTGVNDTIISFNGKYKGAMLEGHFAGIPLTEEWLLKFGFVNNGFGGFEKKYNPSKYNDSKIIYRVGKGSLPVIGYTIWEGAHTMRHDIEFVHQLQNWWYYQTDQELL